MAIMLDPKISRRGFLSIASMTILGYLTGCGVFSGRRGELSKVGQGFNAYNGFNPNLKRRHIQRQTWLDNVVEHKVAWAGTQYNLDHNVKIIASADGVVQRAMTFNGYHGKEDSVKIKHGPKLYTRYFHMAPRSYEKFQDKTQFFHEVKRGDIIGLGTPYFKLTMFRQALIGDMDYYGQNMEYMDYWDGKTYLDVGYEEVRQKDEKQIDLMLEMIAKYNGPGSEQLQDLNNYRIPRNLCHNPLGECKPWEHAMVIKFVKFIYDNQPSRFNGTKRENDNLITEMYQNQPVILTLPFMAGE